MGDESERKSVARDPQLIADEEERARAEATNALRQFDRVQELIEVWLSAEQRRRLRPSLILDLQRLAVEGLTTYAGVYRPGGIEIGGSRHTPPPAHLVPELVEELCDYVNDNWSRPAAHLAAYVMWRLNWIHPFVDGNGRTSRALGYFLLCAKLELRLPGHSSLPELIARDKRPYYAALEAADEAARKGDLDVSAMEALLEGLLARQFTEIIDRARQSSTDSNPAKLH
ncbi:Fic family protein [Aquibaculum sediminis]|uniref:Fic family protein n=1 Tax=Aquibaculum sediminis TaxID=3231907 RepID=UPI0034559DBB